MAARVLATVLLAAPVFAGNILLNGSFEQGSAGPLTVTGAGDETSISSDWGFYNNHTASTTEELLPTTLNVPGAGSTMLYVDSTNVDSGPYQLFAEGSYYAGVWIDNLSGDQGVEVEFLDGTSEATAHLVARVSDPSIRQNVWEFISFAGPVTANDLTILGSDYYVDLADVDTSPVTAESATPEPGTWILLVSCFIACAGFRLRKWSGARLGLPLAALVAGLSGSSAQAGPITWNISTIAQEGSAVGGYTIYNLNNVGDVGIAPDNNYVAYRSAYSASPGGGSGSGIFGSDGTVVAHSGESLAGGSLNYVLYGPDVNDSHDVLYAAYAPSSYLVYATYDAATQTNTVSGTGVYQTFPLYHGVPFGLENSDGYLGASYGNYGYSVADAAGVVSEASSGMLINAGEYDVAVNDNGAGVYTATPGGSSVATVYDSQGNVIAQAGSVIGGITLYSIGVPGGTAPVSINDDGTVAFLAYYNNENSCGIFSQTSLLQALPYSECNVTAININDSGSLAWFDRYQASLYTQDGLVSNQVGVVGNRFFNNLGSLAYILNGAVDLATPESAAPEPGTFWLAAGIMAIVAWFLWARRRRLLLTMPVAALAVGFSGDSAQAGPITWNISTVAQAGSVVGGYTLTNNLAFSSLAPNDDYVAYQANYSQNGTSHSGIFASDGTAVAVVGEQFGGSTISYFSGYGPYVDDSHSVMFEAGDTSGYTDAYTGTSLLSGDYIAYQGNNRAYNVRPVGYSDSGAFIGEYEGYQSFYFGNGSGLLDQIAHVDVSGVASNNPGQGVYSTTSNTLYDLQNNLLAGPGTVIAGYTLSSVGYGGDPVAINNSGTVAFVGFWNGGANCGIFTLTTLVTNLTGNCGVTGLNINDSGEVAWLNGSGDLYTQYGLVSSSAVNVGNRFLNNLGDLTFENTAGQIELATQVSAAPEPGTVWLALIAVGVIGTFTARRGRCRSGQAG